MNFKPYPYQRHAIQHIYKNPFCGLFLQMGLGKTIITLTALKELMFERFEVGKVLIIAPKTVAQTVWTGEVEKWFGFEYLEISKVLGTEKQRKEALKKKAHVYVINRENVVWLVALYGQKWPFDTVVIDELSSFKSSKAARFRALKKVRPFMRRVIGLTGTPAPNSLLDLWPQLYLLDQGERLGHFVTNYRDNHFDYNAYKHKYTIKEKHAELIHNGIKDICISMKTRDYLDLPERIDRDRVIEFSPAVFAKYEKFVRDEILKIDDATNIDVVNAAVLRGKLLQFTNGAIYDENKKVHEIHDEKLSALYEDIEAANGEPALVFYQYRHDLPRLMKALKVFRPETFDKSEKHLKRWNNKEIPVLLLHAQSAGHGLNMQDGGYIVNWFGLTHSSEYYEQAVARVDRQGQKNRVLNNRFIVKNTVDEDVLFTLINKMTGQNALMYAVKAIIEKYS